LFPVVAVIIRRLWRRLNLIFKFCFLPALRRFIVNNNRAIRIRIRILINGMIYWSDKAIKLKLIYMAGAARTTSRRMPLVS